MGSTPAQLLRNVRLEGAESFDRWLATIENVFIVAKASKHLQQPSTTDSSNEDYIVKDKELMVLLWNTLIEDDFRLIRCKPFVSDGLEALKTKYRPSTTHGKMNALLAIHQIPDSSDPENILLDIDTAKSRLESFDFKLEDDFYVYLAAVKLKTTLKAFSENISNGLLKFNNFAVFLTSALEQSRIYKSKRHSQDSSSLTMAASSTCSYCHRVRHTAEECRRKKRDEQRKRKKRFQNTPSTIFDH